MIYQILSIATLLFHLGFILFVIFGGLLVFRWKRIWPFHIACVVWGVLVEVFRWGCPLTSFEKYFRNLAGLEGYNGGFIEHYLLAIIYPDGWTPVIGFILAVVVVVINLAIYAILLKRVFGIKPHGH